MQPHTAVSRRLGRFVAIALIGMSAACARAADTATIAVTAVVLSKSNCKITSAKTATIDFLTIDPSSTASVTKSAAMQLTCNGSAPNATFLISPDNGLNPTAGGTRRMRNAGDGNLMTYALGISPAASATVTKGTPYDFSVDATLVPTDFAAATAGAYSDTVTITLSP